jgi:hypothetical protein
MLPLLLVFFVTGKSAVDSWYNEIKQYNFQNAQFSSTTGHFTQLVWKSTQKLGIGVALGAGDTSVYIVAQFSPQGNYLGRFQENVPPPQ